MDLCEEVLLHNGYKVEKGNMNKPLEYLSPEALEQLRACGPQTPKEILRFWLEVGRPPDGEKSLEDHFSAELIEEVKQEMANEQEEMHLQETKEAEVVRRKV